MSQEILKDVALIPRQVLFGNPQRAMPRLSPDGKKLAMLAPVDGVLNVWVGELGDPQGSKPVTSDKVRGIRSYCWAYTNKHILYVQDAAGDEDWHVYCVNLETQTTVDLTPFENVHASIQETSHRIPGEILISINDRDPEIHDIYRVNLESGERVLVEKNAERFANFVTDEDFQVRFASKMNADGGRDYFKKEGDDWKPFVTIPMEDSLTAGFVGFDKTGDVLYLIDSHDRNTGALFAWNLKTNERSLIAENNLCDIGDILFHPTENTIHAVSFTHLLKEWKVIDEAVADDFEYLENSGCEMAVVSRSLDDQQWIVAFTADDAAVAYHHYDRHNVVCEFLFYHRDDLENLPLVKMEPVVIKSRDGLDLVSYLSLPPHCNPPKEPLPMVLLVHGGPWGRDDWGFDPQHQLLANRGYAVLSVNFRGSTGFGKEFVNAGNKEWAGKMHDDLLDAVAWAVDKKIADPKLVAIMGGSYGGYATLVGLTFSPEVFACGIDIVGPSNILTLLDTVPPYWKPAMQMFKDRVGDFTSEEGRAFLTERSPLTHVDKITKPLLIAQGKNDPRVKQSESDQIVAEMQNKGIPVTYVLYPDEGHGFARPENRFSFNAVTEAFLSQHLGGRYESIGEAFEGSTITVPAGAEQVPGLKESLQQSAASRR